MGTTSRPNKMRHWTIVLVVFPILVFTPTLSLAQESPFVEIETFATGRDFRTNVCERQRQVMEGNLTLEDALNGLQLSVAMTNYQVPNEDKFFTLVDNKIKETDPGLFVEIMDEVARRSGFEWRNSFVGIPPLSGDANRTWTQLLEWEVSHFDIAADYWGRSSPRMALGIAFPKGWYDGSIILVQSKDAGRSKFSQMWSFLDPFHYRVWMLILFSIVFTGICYWLLERLNLESDERELENKPMAAIFLASLTFTGHFEFWPNTNAARLLSFSWTFWALILSSAYTANMASFLVSRNEYQYPITTFEEALKQDATICVQQYSVTDESIRVNYPDLKVLRKVTEQQLFEALRLPVGPGLGGCDAAVTNLGTYEVYSGNPAVNDDCSLTTEKRVLLNLPAGFATKVDTGNLCSSLISYTLNLHLTAMKADGFIDQKWREHILKISKKNCFGAKVDESGGSEDENFSLRLNEMAGIFILHLALTFLAVCIALFELLRRFKEKRSSHAPLGFRRGRQF